jgi:hypothetical protein
MFDSAFIVLYNDICTCNILFNMHITLSLYIIIFLYSYKSGIQQGRKGSDPSHKAITAQLMHLFWCMISAVNLHLIASLTGCEKLKSMLAAKYFGF